MRIVAVVLLLITFAGCAASKAAPRPRIGADPIRCEPSPACSAYLERVRKQVASKWSFPCAPNNDGEGECAYEEASLVLEIAIAKDGTVPDVTVVRSSGNSAYDDHAVKAVQAAAPFPPIPDAFSTTGVRIRANFRYVVEPPIR
jgi:TonB family protein